MATHKVKHGNHKHSISKDSEEAFAQAKEKIVDAAECTWEESKQLLEKVSDDVKAKSAEMAEVVGKYTQKKPLKAIGLSLLAGAAIALILRR